MRPHGKVIVSSSRLTSTSRPSWRGMMAMAHGAHCAQRCVQTFDFQNYHSQSSGKEGSREEPLIPPSRPGLPYPPTAVSFLKVDVREKKIRLSTMQSHREELDVPPDNDAVRLHGRETGPKEFGRYWG
jgi:hypothetical protein